jgi:hypothetical protein
LGGALGTLPASFGTVCQVLRHGRNQFVGFYDKLVVVFGLFVVVFCFWGAELVVLEGFLGKRQIGTTREIKNRYEVVTTLLTLEGTTLGLYPK